MAVASEATDPTTDSTTTSEPTSTSRPSSTVANDLELRLLEHRRELLDDRAEYVNWWLVATAIFLTLLGLILPLMAYRGFRRLDRMEADAQRSLQEIQDHAKQAGLQLKTLDDRAKVIAEGTKLADSRMRTMTAESTIEDPARAENMSAIVRDSGMSVTGLAISEAIAAQQRKDYRSSIDKWRQVALISSERDPKQAARAWFSVGFLLEIQVGDIKDDRAKFDDAIEAYGSAIRLHPDYSEAYFNRGNLRYQLCQYEAAILDYTSSIRILSKPSALYNRGNAYFRSQRFVEAVADYDRALSMLHERPDVSIMHILHNKANALLGEGKLQQAQECLRSALSMGNVSENTRHNMDFVDEIRNLDSRPDVQTDSALKQDGQLSILMQLDASVEDMQQLSRVPHKDNFGNVGSMGSQQMTGGKGGKGGSGFGIVLQSMREI